MSSLPRIPWRGREWVSGKCLESHRHLSLSHRPGLARPWGAARTSYHGEAMEEGGRQPFLNCAVGEWAGNVDFCSRP